jgi:hypothetical protein
MNVRPVKMPLHPMSFYKPKGKYTDLTMSKYCALKASSKHEYSDPGIMSLRTRVR